MIRVGIGGWTFEPWRGAFYPEGLKHAEELAYASRHLTTIEINGTFYRTQSAASFAKWRDETPEGFVFAVKGHRAIVNSKKLAEAGDAIAWFLGSGVLELGEKLGPSSGSSRRTRSSMPMTSPGSSAFCRARPAAGG